jgi:hypothetical protein
MYVGLYNFGSFSLAGIRDWNRDGDLVWLGEDIAADLWFTVFESRVREAVAEGEERLEA